MNLLAQTNRTVLVSVNSSLIREIRQQYQNIYVSYLPLKTMFKVENWVEYWPTGNPH